MTRQNDNHSPGPGPGPRRLAPSSHQRSELSNTILGTFSRGDKRVWKCIPDPNGLGEKATLINISVSNGNLICHRMIIPAAPNQGDKFICWYSFRSDSFTSRCHISARAYILCASSLLILLKHNCMKQFPTLAFPFWQNIDFCYYIYMYMYFSRSQNVQVLQHDKSMQTAFNPGSGHNILTPLHSHNALSHLMHNSRMQSSMQKDAQNPLCSPMYGVHRTQHAWSQPHVNWRTYWVHNMQIDETRMESTIWKLTHVMSPHFANKHKCWVHNTQTHEMTANMLKWPNFYSALAQNLLNRILT